MRLKAIAAQARIEILLTLRRGESVLATIVIPVGILVFFTGVDVLPHEQAGPTDFLVPGVLGLAAVATGMVSLGIATAFERQGGVLKRLGATPLGRGGLVAAKIVSVLAIVALQSAAILAVGLGLGWRPDPDAATAAGSLLMGTIAFASLGLALAGTLRAETNLAVANGLFLVMLLLGGILVPISHLPEVLEGAARVLPAEPLVSLLRGALAGDPVSASGAVTLAVWTVGGAAVAATTFRWD